MAAWLTLAEISKVTKMGKLDTDSFEQFLESIKQAGVVIFNEHDLRERMAEAHNWRFAFTTMLANGHRAGIFFEDKGHRIDEKKIHRAFSKFKLPKSSEAILATTLNSVH
ncbi:hypothetical protein [Gallionella capsiferriformans]|jgi:Xaa-Pro aminopeptidase|nr:hypothetical protein [Gallionella capsiferriformans]